MSNTIADLKAELLARMVRGEITMPDYKQLFAEIERHAAEVPADPQPAPLRQSELTNSIGMRFVRIPAGEFVMGSTGDDEWLDEDELDNDDDDSELAEQPPHLVRITQSFYMGMFPVTQQEYQAVIGQNPSRFSGDPRRPVENVSWDDAVSFCEKLSQLASETERGNSYRLPTEAEWEYASRAGATEKRCCDYDEYDEYMWHCSNSGDKTQPVGEKKGNAWGLHDMLGNVWEWCHDWYDKNYYIVSPQNDPVGPASGWQRVLRGGSWVDMEFGCYSARRSGSPPGVRGGRFGPIGFIGFRVAAVHTEYRR